VRLLLIREAAIYLQSQANRVQTVNKSNVQAAAISSVRVVYLRKRYQVAVQSLPEITSPASWPIREASFFYKVQKGRAFQETDVLRPVCFLVAKIHRSGLINHLSILPFTGIVCVNK